MNCISCFIICKIILCSEIPDILEQFSEENWQSQSVIQGCSVEQRFTLSKKCMSRHVIQIIFLLQKIYNI